jgi:import inner membrane translocase subunit TIM23
MYRLRSNCWIIEKPRFSCIIGVHWLQLAADASIKTKPILPKPSLTWKEYFHLRKWRSYRQKLVGIPMAVGSLLGTSYGAATYVFEHMKPDQLLFGMDPLIVTGLASMGSGIVGYMVGAILSGTMWRWIHPQKASWMDEKDKELIRKIEKYRADPSTQPLFGGLPDYYGEKIYSIEQYHKWLKSQRKHRNNIEIDLFKTRSTTSS